MKLSIIAPVFNVEKFLTNFIESVLSQSYSDFEFILVDDGSTDSSGLICDKYALKDSRIRVVHKPNGGVDSARNKGIDESKGEYYYFADSDDALLPNCLETLINGIEMDPKNELAIGGYVYSRNGLIEEKKDLKIENHIFTRERTMEEILCPKYHTLGMPWTNLYKASVINENSLRFNKNIHTIDDRLFMVEYVNKMKGTAFHTTKPIYIYNLGVGVSFQINKKFDKRQATIFDGQCLIYQMVKNGNFTKKAEWWARFRMMNSYFFKKKYFEDYQDFATVQDMTDKLFAIISHREYKWFLLRKRIAVFVKSFSRK